MRLDPGVHALETQQSKVDARRVGSEGRVHSSGTRPNGREEPFVPLHSLKRRKSLEIIIRSDFDRNESRIECRRSVAEADSTCDIQLSKYVRSMEQLTTSGFGCELPRWPLKRPKKETM